MYQSLLLFHTWMRWLVLISILFAIYQAYTGLSKNRLFSKFDNAIRHWTATFAHIQLTLGILLYTQSPLVSHYWKNNNEIAHDSDAFFFGIVHLMMMLMAIVVLTIGSAKAKRKPTDKEKYRTILVWFSIALFLIFIAIPWPFSPLSERPYLR